MRRHAIALFTLLLTAACTAGADDEAAPEDSSAASTSASGMSTPPTLTVAPGDRTYDVVVPADTDEASPLPLVVLLHGYASSGAEIDAYVGLGPLAQQRGFLYVTPDGSPDSRDNRFWDATDACCNFTGTPVDDAGYLAGLIADVGERYPVDEARVYLVGHSNGGFMAYRMACEYSGLVAAVVSIAGATFADPAQCAPSTPVSVLQIHGDADGTISYTGGSFPAVYPGARQTVQTWRDYNGCSEGVTAALPAIDLEADLPGPESTIASSDCGNGASVDLWTIAGGGHVPALSPTFATQVVDWLYAHPRSG